MLRDYGVFGLLLDSISVLLEPDLCFNAGSKSEPFPVRVGLHQGCPLSLVLFIIFMYRISMCIQVTKPSLLFVDSSYQVTKLIPDTWRADSDFTLIYPNGEEEENGDSEDEEQ